MKKGKIVQVSGPVIDVEFADGDLPYIKDALEVTNNGKRCVMEVAQHIGDNMVRCIMLASSEGLHKDMEVTATGSGIKVPVGEKTLEDCSTCSAIRSTAVSSWRRRSTGVSTERRRASRSRVRS